MASIAQQPDRRVRIGLAIIAALVVVRFAIVPWLGWQAERVDAIRTMERKLASIQARLDQQAQLQQTLGSLRAREAELTERFFTEAAADDLQLKIQGMIEDLVREQGLEIQRSDWRQVTTDSLIRAPLTLVVAGPVDGVAGLVSAIESQPRFLAIEQLDMRRAGSRSRGVTATFTIVGYGLPTGEGGA